MSAPKPALTITCSDCNQKWVQHVLPDVPGEWVCGCGKATGIPSRYSGSSPDPDPCPECGMYHSANKCPAEPIIDPERDMRVYAERVQARIIERISDPVQFRSLLDLAVQRAQSIGAQQYGNAAYKLNDYELAHEGAQEIADLIFYEHVRVKRHFG